MNDLIIQIITSVISCATVVLTLFTIGRSIIEKALNKWIETAFEKKTLEFSDKLDRHKRAFTLLLDKEFNYYVMAGQYASDLIVDVQALCDNAQNKYGQQEDVAIENAKKKACELEERVYAFRNVLLMNQCFIHEAIWDISMELVHGVEGSIGDYLAVIENAISRIENEKDILIIEEDKDIILKITALLMNSIRARLIELSGYKG